VLPPLLARRDFCIVALGSGEPRYEQFFASLQRRFPARVVFYRGYRRRTRALDRSGRRHLRDAVAVRALRPEPDVQPALRHHSDRAAHRRTRRLRAAVDPDAGTGTGIVFNDFDAAAMAGR
jgi:starch synthase